ncbi:MAG: hypothetical protein P8M25_18285, partial [Paracoccaceae bacterium]|nr:hypothetical protein [Paracoccaceae bacterium]
MQNSGNPFTKDEILKFDLGSHSFKVSTVCVDTQHFFDLGLNWCFGFNQEEGLVCFKKALEYDPNCAMLHWGIAYAAGPFYNMPWADFCKSEATECTALCRDHLDRALKLSKSAS